MLPEISCADSYRILGLNGNATNEQIKVAYKRLALQWHPDRHADNKDFATERFVEVSNAYRTVLRDRRSHYQDSREVPPLANFHPPSSPLQSKNTFPISKSNLPTPGLNSSMDSSSTQESYTYESKEFGGDSYYVNALPYQRESPASLPHIARKSERYDPAPTPVPRKINLPAEDPQRRESRRRKGQPPTKPEGWEHVSTSPKRRTSAPMYAPDLGQTNSPFSYPSPPSTPTNWQEIPAEWIFYLHLSLEELFQGKSCKFQLVRRLRSGRQKEVVVDFRIPPGCHHGTRFVCRGIGHERSDGSAQDIVFVVDELRHDRFFRIEDDLMLNVVVPWPDYVHTGGNIYVNGLEGAQYTIHPPQTRRTVLKGVRTIAGAGMPISEGERVIGRGDLIVCWEVTHPSISRWDGLMRALHFRR